MKGINFRALIGDTSDTGERREGDRRSFDITILIIDDSKTVVMSIDKILGSAGIKTLVATSGEEGIALAQEFSPDLIIMDVFMPGMSGFEATRLLRTDDKTNEIPILIISANQMPTEKMWCERLGANGFMAKPIARAELFENLHRIFADGEKKQG